MQQQSVLLLAARGPDGIPKEHPCKRLQVSYRACVLKAAYYGREMEWGEKADTFMSLDEFANDRLWEAIVTTFFRFADQLPHHYYMHLIHGAEIIGYKHPDARFRMRWREFYRRCVEEFHLQMETEAEMDGRLCDWGREAWS